jgi:hypothetical protein
VTIDIHAGAIVSISKRREALANLKSEDDSLLGQFGPDKVSNEKSE